jgi:hypothetical protein
MKNPQCVFADIRWNDGTVETVLFSFMDCYEDISSKDDEHIFFYLEDRNDLHVGYTNGEWTIVE